MNWITNIIFKVSHCKAEYFSYYIVPLWCPIIDVHISFTLGKALDKSWLYEITKVESKKLTHNFGSNCIVCTSGPHCIKLFAGVFYGKNQETPAKKKKSIAICIEICQSFFMAKKCLAKSFMQRGPGMFLLISVVAGKLDYEINLLLLLHR